MPLTGEHVPEDYLDALREYLSVGGDVQLSYTTKFLRLADGLVSGKRLSNLPANWQASKSINKSLAEQKEFMLNLCRAAGFETGSPRPGPSHDALMVYAQACPLPAASGGLGSAPPPQAMPAVASSFGSHAAGSFFPAASSGGGFSGGLGLAPLQATDGEPQATFSQMSSVLGQPLSPLGAQMDLTQINGTSLAALPTNLAATDEPHPAAEPADQEGRALPRTKNRSVRILEALGEETVRVHLQQIQHGLRGDNATASNLSAKLMMNLTAVGGPLHRLMGDSTFCPVNRYAGELTLGIGSIDPSQPVEDGDLQGWVRDLKTKCTKAYNLFREQTGVPSPEPNARTVGNNPVLLYAVRMMHADPQLLAALNGAMAENMQSEAGPNGMPSLPTSLTAPQPSRARMPQPGGLGLLPASPLGPGPGKGLPPPPALLPPVPGAGLPYELAMASSFQAQAAWGAIFAAKCDGVCKVAQALHYYQGVTKPDDEQENRLHEILKRSITAVEADAFYEHSCRSVQPKLSLGEQEGEEGE